MGNVEDVRKVIQDFVAPDMKAIAARIEALEKEMGIQFKALRSEFDVRFTAADHKVDSLKNEMNVRFTSTEQRIASLEKEMNLRFTAAEQLAASRHENLMNAMSSHHSSIMNSLEMEKRLARLESDRSRLPALAHEQ